MPKGPVLARRDERVASIATKLLREKGLSKSRVAQETGVHVSTIGAALGGIYRPNIWTARKIAQVLGARLEELFPRWYPACTKCGSDLSRIPDKFKQ